MLEQHALWLRHEGGEQADFSNANLRNVNFESSYLIRADLSNANLNGVRFECTNLRNANLAGAVLQDIVMSWSSHNLISEILWRTAKTQSRQMLVAFISKKTDWCWELWQQFDHPDREWALNELAKWVKQGDNAPSCVKSLVK